MKQVMFVMLMLSAFSILCAQDNSFEIPTEEKEQRLEWSGNLDGKYTASRMRTYSPLYQLQFGGQDTLPEWLSQYRLDLYLNADYQTKDIGFHLKTHGTYYGDSLADFNLFEAYGNWNLSVNTFIQAGKKTYNWGKGYAFNPVGYVNPFKNPENPELAQTGLLSLNFETVKSFQSDILKIFALTGVVIPPADLINNRYAEIENTDIALKGYFLLWDTDVDLLGYYSRVNPIRIGADFSTNVMENMEVHGEASYFDDAPRYIIANNTLLQTRINGYAYLVGLRYLNKWNTTIIAEYYHNDAALTQPEYDDYFDFTQNSASNVNGELRKRALSYSKAYFSGSTSMQDYVYLKISQPEPFNLLYFTPSLFTIFNIQDRSFQLAAPLSYKPVTNFEFLFWPTLLIGVDGTEFGARQAHQLLDVWMRVYF